MPRKPRQEAEGAVHHVYARSVRGSRLFMDDADRQTYLRLLGRATERCGWLSMSYCLMRNHIHLLIETPKPNLGDGMRWMHGRYGDAFNRRHRTAGHVFDGRYGSTPMKTDVHLWIAARYVARNPVEAGLCEEAGEWPWSSYPATIAGDGPAWLATGRLLEYLAGAGGDPRHRYAEL